MALWANNRDTLRQEWEIFQRGRSAAEPTACKLLRKASLQPDIETNYSKTKLNPDAPPFHPALPLQSTSCKASLMSVGPGRIRANLVGTNWLVESWSMGLGRTSLVAKPRGVWG